MRGKDELLSQRLGTPILGGRILVGSDRRNMDEPRMEQGGGTGDCLGSRAMHGVEALSAGLGQDADQIDDRIRVAGSRPHGLRITQIGLHGMDLTDPAERLEVSSEIRPAHGGTDTVALLGQRAHHMAAEKTRTAKHRDQRFHRNGSHADTRIQLLRGARAASH
jgi:hypothetical protein